MGLQDKLYDSSITKVRLLASSSPGRFEFWVGRTNRNPFLYFTRCKNIRQAVYQFLDNVYVKSILFQFITIC